MAKKMTEAKLIAEACGDLKLRAAAEWFNEKLEKPYRRSHMAVKNWQDGVYKPDDVFIDALLRFYPIEDPRHQLAAELLTMREQAEGLVEA